MEALRLETQREAQLVEAQRVEAQRVQAKQEEEAAQHRQQEEAQCLEAQRLGSCDAVGAAPPPVSLPPLSSFAANSSFLTPTAFSSLPSAFSSVPPLSSGLVL